MSNIYLIGVVFVANDWLSEGIVVWSAFRKCYKQFQSKEMLGVKIEINVASTNRENSF